jgi:hypothetical protein
MHLQHLAGIDAQALGVSREKHHRYLINDPSTEGILFYQGDACVGYAYIAEGHIGPLAVAHSDHMATAFRTALPIAAGSGTSQVTAFVSGPSEAALNAAVEAGMRITLPMVLMSSHDFGNWAQYLPRNPGFM